MGKRRLASDIYIFLEHIQLSDCNLKQDLIPNPLGAQKHWVTIVFLTVDLWQESTQTGDFNNI